MSLKIRLKRAGSKKRPNLKLLDEQEWLSTEDLAEVLGIGLAQAGRRRARGEFGFAHRRFQRLGSIGHAVESRRGRRLEHDGGSHAGSLRVHVHRGLTPTQCCFSD